MSWENLSSGVCEQHRRRPACASAQSDQCLFYSLFWKYHMNTCYRRNFNSLASLCSWGVWNWNSLSQKRRRQVFSRRGPFVVCLLLQIAVKAVRAVLLGWVVVLHHLIVTRMDSMIIISDVPGQLRESFTSGSSYKLLNWIYKNQKTAYAIVFK